MIKEIETLLDWPLEDEPFYKAVEYLSKCKTIGEVYSFDDSGTWLCWHMANAINPSQEIYKPFMDFIKQKPWPSCLYARYVIRARCLELEEIIKQDKWALYEYTKHVTRGRCLELEEMIKEMPWVCSDYAIDIIKGRWPEMEESIKKDAYIKLAYEKAFGIKL